MSEKSNKRKSSESQQILRSAKTIKMSPNLDNDTKLSQNWNKVEDCGFKIENSPDWRTQYGSAEEIMGHCVSMGLFANAIFEGRAPQMENPSWRIEAIKEILWIHSPVLENLTPENSFLPPEQSPDSLPLYRIPCGDDDKNFIEETTFRDFLKYAYTLTWDEPQRVINSKNLNSTIGLWKLAKKLEVRPLENKIHQFLQTTLGHSNNKGHFEDDDIESTLDQNVSKKLNQLLDKDMQNESLDTPKKMAAPKKEDSIKISQFATLPSELLCKIFRQIPSPELLNFRLISKRIQTIIQDNKEIDLTVAIGEAQLTRTKWLTTSSSWKKIPFRKLMVKLKVLTLNLKNGLLNFFKFLIPTGAIQMQLTIESIPDSRILHSFLHSMSQMRGSNLANRLQLHLVLGTVTCLGYCISTQAPPSYQQIRSLGLKNLVGAQERPCCLLRLVRNAPNLKEIFLGHCNRRAPLEAAADVFDFLKAAISKSNLKNVQISNFKVTNLPATAITRGSCLELKKMGMIFRMVHFVDSGVGEQLEFVKQFCAHLQTIYFAIKSDFSQSTNGLLFSPEEGEGGGELIFPKLRVLRIKCDSRQLSNILQRMPNLRHLSWLVSPGGAVTITRTSQNANGENGSAILKKNQELIVPCPKLTRLTVHFSMEKSEDELAEFINFENYFQNVTILHCYLSGVCRSLRHVYQLFPGVMEFKILNAAEDMTNENILGLPEILLDDGQLRDPLFLDRPPYIGCLKKLKILKLDLLDYQKYGDQWNWPLKLTAFTHGICHLSELKEIHFPPLEKRVAECLLTFLAVHMTQLEKVILQYWADGDVTGVGMSADAISQSEGTLTPGHVEELRSSSLKKICSFQIICSPVFLCNDSASYTIM